MEGFGMVPISLDTDVSIPPGITDVEAFRRWALSDDFPQRGRFSFLGDEVWVDLSMEQLFTHNRVKTRIGGILDGLIAEQLGFYFSDRALLSHPEVGLSTEPDGLFVSYESLQRGRVQLTEGRKEGHVELVGSPDMVLEVVSDRSVQKDTERLRRLYFDARIPEYWLVDARGEKLRFDLLRRGSRGYSNTRHQDGWVRSAVFGRAFRLTRHASPLGLPEFRLEVRD
jgi:Uma2 family endonuclease